MGKKISVSIIFFTIILLLFLTIVPAAAAATTTSDKYVATTADGVELAMKRYRPDQKAGFRKHGQPVILMPGIMSNSNYFDIYTPAGKTYNVQLPSPLPTWAKHDRYIKKDPMRYFSMAHYLWTQGYDVWVANYRGQGRDPYMSGGATGYSLDDCGIYDVPAIVEKVYEVTKKHPIWMGHSMGSSMANIYLQGAKYGEGENPHVISDPALAAERNGGNGKQSLKALVYLDGPMGTAGGPAIDMPAYWELLNCPWYVDFRFLLSLIGDSMGVPTYFLDQISWFFFQMLGCPDLGILNVIFLANPNNFEPNVMTYMLTYGLDGTSTRSFAQLQEAHVHHKFREDYLNGPENASVVVPPVPAAGDGYYYYSDNLSKITLPAMVIADDTCDLTMPEDIHNFYLWKGRNPVDVFMRVPDTAHADIVCGLKGPSEIWPEINKWVKKLPRQK